MTFQPIDITRIDADRYIVGAVHLIRQPLLRDGQPATFWGAYPHGNTDVRPLFTAFDLEAILDMAHGAVEMMRPAEPVMTRGCIECGAPIAVGHFCDDCRATS